MILQSSSIKSTTRSNALHWKLGARISEFKFALKKQTISLDLSLDLSLWYTNIKLKYLVSGCFLSQTSRKVKIWWQSLTFIHLPFTSDKAAPSFIRLLLSMCQEIDHDENSINSQLQCLNNLWSGKVAYPPLLPCTHLVWFYLHYFIFVSVGVLQPSSSQFLFHSLQFL